MISKLAQNFAKKHIISSQIGTNKAGEDLKSIEENSYQLVTISSWDYFLLTQLFNCGCLSSFMISPPPPPSVPPSLPRGVPFNINCLQNTKNILDPFLAL
jgi:hypothetical protein